MSKTLIDGLADEIAKVLSEYTSDVEEGLEKAKKKAAQNGAKKLRNTSPRKSGKYAKGWSSKKNGTSYVIHNRTRYQITHLLEKGHAKVGGGRVAPIVHIKPVEDKVIKEFENEVERVIKG